MGLLLIFSPLFMRALVTHTPLFPGLSLQDKEVAQLYRRHILPLGHLDRNDRCQLSKMLPETSISVALISPMVRSNSPDTRTSSPTLRFM